MINVTSYGAKGNGVTDDWSAFNQAITAAKNTGDFVYVPLGNYYINTANGVLLIPSNSNVLIQGVGVSSRLKFGPEGLAIAASGIRVDSAATLGLHDLKLEGPDTLTGIGELITIQTWTDATRLNLIRCSFAKSFTCVKGEGGNAATRIYAEGCSFDASGQGLLLVDQSGELNAGVAQFENCTFNMTDLVPTPAYGVSQHNIYINGGWALVINKCDFQTTGEAADGLCIHGYGGLGARPIQPWYIKNTTFRTRFGVQTNEFVTTFFDNCTFNYKSTGIEVREGGAVIRYCNFSPHTLAGGAAISDYSFPASIVCEDSVFSGGLNQNGVFACYIVRYKSDGTEWIFRRCTFGGGANDDSVMSTYPDELNANFRFEDCVFGACGKDLGYIRCGMVYLQRCRVNANKLLYIYDGFSGNQVSYGNVNLTLDGCFGQGVLVQINGNPNETYGVTFLDEHNNNCGSTIQASSNPRTRTLIP